LREQGAVDELRSFHQRVAGTRPVLFVVFNSQFDAAFSFATEQLSED
jgi:hypothetical protein